MCRHLFLTLIVCLTLLPLRTQGQPHIEPGAGVLPTLDQIKPGHPRIFLRPNHTDHAVSLQQLRAPLDRDGDTLLAQLKSQQSAAAQAMVWLLSKEDAAAERAIRRMREYRYLGEVDTFHIFFRLTEFALAYDWLYSHPSFTDSVRAEIRASVAPLAREGLRVSNDHLFHNYVWMSAGGVALWAVATAHDDEASNELFTQIRERFNTRLFPAMQYLDGLPSEPMGYWALYCYTPALYTVLAAQSATETDLVDQIRTHHGDWLRRHFRTVHFSTLPDLRYVPFGDLQSGPNGGVTRDMAGVIDASTWALRSSDGLAISTWLAEKRGLSRFRADTALLYFLYSRSLGDRVEKDPPSPSLSHIAGNENGGHYIARSDWSDDATVVAFRCADHYGDHNHWDQGSFLIYRRGLLAVDPPVYRTTRGPQQKTEYHNTLLIGGQPQRPVRGQTFPTLEQFRRNLTQGKRLETGDLLFHHDANTWCAVAGQFAQAYDVPALKSCVRQLLYIRPGTIVIIDQLEAQAGQRLPDIQWLLHFPSQPESQDDGLLARTDHSFIRCRPVTRPSGNPLVEPTPMNTVRATYSYTGDERRTLGHVVDVGSAGDVPRPADAGAQILHDRVEVSLGASRFRFATSAPFGVTKVTQ